MLKRNSNTVHSNTQQLALQSWRLSKVGAGAAGRMSNFEKCLKVFAKSPDYYPAYYIGAD